MLVVRARGAGEAARRAVAGDDRRPVGLPVRQQPPDVICELAQLRTMIGLACTGVGCTEDLDEHAAVGGGRFTPSGSGGGSRPRSWDAPYWGDASAVVSCPGTLAGGVGDDEATRGRALV